MVALVPLVALACAARPPDPFADLRTCDALHAPYVIINLRDLVAERIPSTRSIAASAFCQKTAEEGTIEAWRNEDRASDALLNRACSARLGWQERQPGTCRAGGPPPICVQDHWFRVPPGKAEEEFRRFNRAEYYRRFQALREKACRCALDGMKAAEGAVLGGGRTGDSMFPCDPSGRCPMPGAECVAGYCQIQEVTPGGEFAKRAGSTAKDVAADAAIEAVARKLAEKYASEALEYLLDVVLKAKNLTGVTIALGIFESPLLSTELDAYKAAAARFQRELRALTDLEVEYARAMRAPRLNRDRKLILADVAKTRPRLATALENMSIAANGVVRERGLEPSGCVNVFEYSYQRAAKAGRMWLSSRLPGE